MIEASPHPILRIGPEGTLIYGNPASSPLLKEWGCRPGGAVPHNWRRLLEKVASSGKTTEIEAAFAGRVFSFALIPGEGHVGLYGRDITDQRKTELTLSEQAIQDPLTGLYNRRYLNTLIREEMARSDRSRQPFAVLLCDLDHFKRINDTRGHQNGDETLRAVANTIRNATRGTDLVFRWGGDEFVVLLSNVSRKGVIIAANRIRAGIQKLGAPDDQELDISFGAAFYPEHGRTTDELIGLADKALYIAKKGGGKIHIGEEEFPLNEQAVNIVFQPVVDIRNKQILGYEALARDPQGRFGILELFRRYQAVGQLHELKCLCLHLELRKAHELGLKRVFINVDFQVLEALAPPPIPPGMEVVLEISELEAMVDVRRCLAITRKWRQKGYQFAIDDFGSGFISLPFISQLIPQYIKMDRSTILQAVSSNQFGGFLKDLVMALRNYSTEGIIAEGVETEKELAAVRDIATHLVQGFLFGKPAELSPKHPEDCQSR